MPAQSVQNSLAAKYGSRLDDIVKKHATDETRWGFQQLPAPIDDGIAMLTKCGFEVYKAGTNMKKANGQLAVGEFYFSASGVAIEPASIIDKDGRERQVAGLQPSVMVNCFDHKKSDGGLVTQDECFDEILNHLRKLGGDTSNVESVADLEGIAEELKEQRPYFRFTTREGKPTQAYPNPRVFTTFLGVKGLEEYTPPESFEGAPVDRTAGAAIPGHAAEPSSNGHVEGADPAAGLDQGDTDSLLEAANNNDAKAQRQLTDMAIAAGASKEAVEGTQTWEDVVALIRESSTGGSEVAADEPVPDPQKGDVVRYVVIDPKTKKPAIDAKTKKAKSPVDCEVSAVYKRNKTADLLLLSDRKTVYKGVKWEELLPAT